MATSKPTHQFIDIDKIEILENNPRTIEENDLQQLITDIKADENFLIQRPALINHTSGRFICYAGQQRVKGRKLAGYKDMPCFVEDDVPKEIQDRRMILDNTHRGKWDLEILTSQFDFTIPELQSMGVEEDFYSSALNPSTEVEKEAARQTLSERFIIPPFSIIDTRSGDWQARKRAWKQIGLDSQETREDVQLVSISGQSTAVYELRNKMREALKRDPTWDEIVAECRRQKLHLFEGASIFDPVLCEVIYTWFCPEQATILDPFAGGSVRGITAAYLGHKYDGIDIREEQVLANAAQYKAMNIEHENGSAMWKTGDSSVVLDKWADTPAFDFVFSCPPYHDLEVYSEDPNDLSNKEWEDFKALYIDIIKKSVALLKDNRFACFVVSEIRDKKGLYKNFVNLTINAFEEAGANFYNEIILINVAGSVPVRVTRQFQSGRKVGRVHQNVLVFYKGDPKQISYNYKKVEVASLDIEQEE